MTTASFGVLAEMTRRKWTYYWLMRYQFPFSTKASAGDSFSITPTFAFDGSIGTSYNFTKQLKAGLFWYGQWHQYSFIYADSEVSNAGFQSLFYSTMDVRLALTSRPCDVIGPWPIHISFEFVKSLLGRTL